MAPVSLSVFLLPFLASQVLASCAHGTSLFPRAAEGEAIKVNTFGYSGNIGPLNWASLDPAANALCATGTRQSPIDMVPGVFNVIPGSSLNLQIPDMTAGTEFENLGTTVEVIAATGGTMSVGGVDYTMKQFHYHLPSEHLDAGTSMAMEMHMVFESAAKQIAVIGTYIAVETGAAAAAPATAPTSVRRDTSAKFRRRQATQKRGGAQAGQAGGIPIMGVATNTSAPLASPLLETVLTNVGAIATPGTATKLPPLAMSEIVNVVKGASFQSYMGSLTTPPCSEGVQWLVSTQPLSIKASTFTAVRDVIGFNARFTQNAPGQPNALEFAKVKVA